MGKKSASSSAAVRRVSSLRSPPPSENGVSGRCATPSIEYIEGSPWLSLMLLVCVILLLPFGIFCLIDASNADDIDPELFHIPVIPFTGALSPNNALNNSHKLYEGRLRGAESLVYHQGHIYSGTSDGKVVDIFNGTIRTVTTLGMPPCGTPDLEPTCGRPLGMRMDAKGHLVVVDSYLGIYRVDPKTGLHARLLNASHQVGGLPSRYLNDIDIASDGSFYITDSSTKWTRAEGMSLIMDNRPRGRLFRFDPETGKTEMLLSHLYGANGVQLSRDEEYLLITESPRCRVLKYYLKGAKAGRVELFAHVPGFPDNIRPSHAGGYWLAMAIVNNPDNFPAYQYFGQYPRLRRVIARVFGDTFLLNRIRSFYGLVIELDGQGNFVRSLHDPSGQQVKAVSEVLDLGNEIYLGSFFSPYMLKLDMGLPRSQSRGRTAL